jgi:hypothetical protein
MLKRLQTEISYADISMTPRFPISWTCLLSAALFGCASSPTASSPIALSGLWGGEHVTLTVNDASSHLEFDCAHGDIPSALKPGADKTFTVPGTFVREHGGPIREDENVDARPAMYIGSVTGQTMQLTIRLTDPDSLIGTFTLIHGAPGRLLKCL